MEMLVMNYNIVYLKASAPTIISRVAASDRPLISGDTENSVKRLMTERKEVYERYADIVVSTNRKSVDKICDEIIKKLEAMYK